jgi:beta-alanine degradation protein BauB
MLKFYLDTGKPMTHHDDAVKVAPDSYKVLLENDAVRVLEVRIKQGAKSEMHSHPRSVAICLNDQRLKFTFPNGKSENADLKRGQAVWLDGISHAVENTGTEDVSSVVVELKK